MQRIRIQADRCAHRRAVADAHDSMIERALIDRGASYEEIVRR